MRSIPALRLILILALALTSAHTAIGRSEARGAVGVLICADGGTTVISLDAQGRPVEAHHTCPDCVLSGLALEDAAPRPLAAPKRQVARMARPVHVVRTATRRQLRVRSRGPPGPV